MRVTLLRAATAERAALAVVSAFAWLVLYLALSVAPDPRGYGTHEALGLPPCGLLAIARVPCPSCGMTTAFAFAVRLEPLAAAHAQPLGFVLALATAAGALAGPWAAATGYPLISRLAAHQERVGTGLLAGLSLAWVYKLAAVLLLGGGGAPLPAGVNPAGPLPPATALRAEQVRTSPALAHDGGRP